MHDFFFRSTLGSEMRAPTLKGARVDKYRNAKFVKLILSGLVRYKRAFAKEVSSVLHSCCPWPQQSQSIGPLKSVAYPVSCQLFLFYLLPFNPPYISM